LLDNNIESTRGIMPGWQGFGRQSEGWERQNAQTQYYSLVQNQ